MKIPLLIKFIQCRRCSLREHVACRVWGGIAPPLWKAYFFGLKWCISFRLEHKGEFEEERLLYERAKLLGRRLSDG